MTRSSFRGTPLPDALDAVANELKILASMSADIQGMVGRLINDPATPLSQISERFQQLDLMTQQVSELAVFLDHLGRGAPADCYLDTAEAAKTVRLTDLADRLSGCSSPSGKAPAGDPEWF
ncbi:MAG: hypothetical protein RQ966_12965 [Acetobacteraceae bacterium]|nr:hypothetical protein [Acetobacteraceae bacterium]